MNSMEIDTWINAKDKAEPVSDLTDREIEHAYEIKQEHMEMIRTEYIATHFQRGAGSDRTEHVCSRCGSVSLRALATYRGLYILCDGCRFILRVEGVSGDVLSMIKATNMSSYGRDKDRLQSEWRSKIFERDGYRCVNCGSKEKLQLAHITPVNSFVRHYEPFRDTLYDTMSEAYSFDNMVTLCERCHMCQHGRSNARDAPLVKRDVLKIFRDIKKHRGWSSAPDKLRRERDRTDSTRAHGKQAMLFDF